MLLENEGNVPKTASVQLRSGTATPTPPKSSPSLQVRQPVFSTTSMRPPRIFDQGEATHGSEVGTHRPFTNIDRDRILRLEMQLDALRGDLLEETREVVKEQTELLFKDVHRVVDDLVARVRVDVQYLGNYVEDIKKVSEDIETERETRARNDIAIQARMACDSASLRTHIELTRLALQAESEKNQQVQSEEIVELRALVDSAWDNFTRVEGTADPKYMFRFDPEDESKESRYKVCVGDTEDINTLYEMAQEAVGDNVIIRKELDDEKNKWAAAIAELKRKTLQLDRNYHRLSRRVESIQLNMQEVSDSGNLRCS